MWSPATLILTCCSSCLGSIKDLGHKAKGVAAETHKELAKKAEEFVCECDEQCSCMQTADNPTTGTVRECDEKCSCKRNQHHGWLDNVAEEVKEDAKYLTRKASKEKKPQMKIVF